jgi:outer membrane lipoprotein-sorting protein
MKKVLGVILVALTVLVLFTGCTQAERVSSNLSQQADNFNVTRQLTVINTRAEDGNISVLFQMTGNFSIQKTGDGDVDVIGENPDGTFYKHFVYLSQDVTYVVQDLDSTTVNKHKFEINFNPKMIIPVQPVVVD